MEQTSENQWARYVSSVQLELKNVMNDALKSLSQFMSDVEIAALIAKVVQKINDVIEDPKNEKILNGPKTEVYVNLHVYGNAAFKSDGDMKISRIIKNNGEIEQSEWKG